MDRRARRLGRRHRPHPRADPQGAHLGYERRNGRLRKRHGCDGRHGHGQWHGGGVTSPLLGGAGDIAYPHYLANGRVPAAPVTLTAKPGQRARLRLINAGSDTAFRVALGGHQLTVTHSDGFPVASVTTDALLIGMGERLTCLSLIHISEPTRQAEISYAVFC